MNAEMNSPNEGYDNSVAVSDFVRMLWSYRRLFIVTICAAGLLIVTGALVSYVTAPAEQIAALRFRVEFDGAEDGLYPNGLQFSTRDITSTSVLNEVFEANELQRYLTLRQFSDSIFVHETSTALELLRGQYEAKLANVKLNAVDRNRLEAEFKTKHDELKTPEYELQLQRPAGLTQLPFDLQSKVLTSVLAAWADHAEKGKGALLYNIPVYSKKIISAGLIETEEFIVAMDLLRADVEKILDNLESIKALPGSHSIRGGEKQDLTLAEIEADLEELLQFKLEPLGGLMVEAKLAKNADVVAGYLRNRLFRVELERQQSAGILLNLENSLSRFLEPGNLTPGLEGGAPGRGDSQQSNLDSSVPELDASFLNLLVNLITRTQDVDFRIQVTKQHLAEGERLTRLKMQSDYYRSTLKVFSEPSRMSRTRPIAIDELKRRFAEIEADAIEALNQVASVYEQISTYNLSPRTLLYTTVSPVAKRTSRAQTARGLGLYAISLFAIVIVLFPIICIVHHNFRRSIRRNNRGGGDRAQT